MTAVIVRIALRYIAGALVAAGFFDSEFADFISYDPEIAMAVQIGAVLVIGAATEYAYALALKWGWTT